ncbi:4Fe-4S single cluster domain-containing protein [Vogesella sp. DC21W]|uniref:4Fe-4S single cluster domain-containing protein n=1 Tax=Vogesella aquatica TaxID=2984206 RepID=A0ABT5J1D2_9NEIS|nr:4Fe-4S single cluster domain-containing protein [Vogesella aquatica]MDC7718629.1 4Fe-4S single cluster domain-containing protein [Vogesella aquatica]
MEIALSRVHYPVTTLGPGRRVGIWFQGCSIRCPGCISVDTWRAKPAETTVEQLVRSITQWLTECDGITISGGEPFDQPSALHALLSSLSTFDKDVLVFTGYSAEQALQMMHSWDGLIDALVSDPFEQHTQQTKPLRGSDNQRLNLLTARGAARFASYERSLTPEDRQLDLLIDKDGTAWLAGIPRPGDLQVLQAWLIAEGHRATTTELPRTAP